MTERLTGELTRAPRGSLTTILVTISGIAFAQAAARWVGRVALGYRRPADVSLDTRGLHISHKLEILGRTLDESETLVPLSNLASISRETRYARLGLYAGLLSLAIGTYVGVGLFVDGVRVPGGSPSLLGLGALLVVLGVVLDYGLSTAQSAIRNTCRLVVMPRDGRSLCVEGLTADAVDAVLATLAESLREGADGTGSRPVTAPETETAATPR